MLMYRIFIIEFTPLFYIYCELISYLRYNKECDDNASQRITFQNSSTLEQLLNAKFAFMQ